MTPLDWIVLVGTIGFIAAMWCTDLSGSNLTVGQLYVSAAAHVPVVWATQVLEGLAKQGLWTRAEIADAAMGERAECVMLNQGPHVVEAVRMLDGILRRTEQHPHEKRAMLRPLRVAR